MKRREFLQMAALAPLDAGLRTNAEGEHGGVAYLGTRDALHVYVVRGETWTKTQELRCAAPGCLVRHPALPVLYATNEIDSFTGRPAGTVSVYRIHANGRLLPLQQKELSLSATLPRAMAISADGWLAAVAGTGGGSYNLFAVEADGRLGALRGVLKETGCGPHAELQTSSHPRHVCFDKAGHVLGSDLGTDRVHVLTVNSGSLQLQRRYMARDGSGPARVTLHRTAPFLALSHQLDEVVSVHPYDAANGLIGTQIHSVHGTVVPLHADHSLLAVQEGSKLKIHRWSARDGRLHEARCVGVQGKVRAAQSLQGTLTLALADEIRRLNLATGRDFRVASSPGLRSVLWNQPYMASVSITTPWDATAAL